MPGICKRSPKFENRIFRLTAERQRDMADNREEQIPVFTSLSEIYGEGPLLEEAVRRYENLKQQFVQHYGRQPELFARAPGSLNPILSFSAFTYSKSNIAHYYALHESEPIF